MEMFTLKILLPAETLFMKWAQNTDNNVMDKIKGSKWAGHVREWAKSS